MDYHDPEYFILKDLERQYPHLIAQTGWLGMTVRMGWIPIVKELLATIDSELTAFERQRVRLGQVKQKWGELRVYYDIDGNLARLHADVHDPAGNHVHIVVSEAEGPITEKMDRIIAVAADKASRMCEVCGIPGDKVNKSGIVMVLCREHAASAPKI